MAYAKSIIDDNEFQKFINTHRHVSLNIGTVCICSFNDIPKGSRRMKYEEGIQYK